MNLSISQRLCALFALVSFITFGAVGFAVHELLARELSRHQETEINTRWVLNKRIIAGASTREAWPFVRHKFNAMSTDGGRTHYWVFCDDPHFLYGAPPPGAQTLAQSEGYGELPVAHFRHPLKTLVRTVEANGERPAVRFMIATDSTPFVETLGIFTRWLMVLAITGAGLMAALGYYIARFSLRPLERASGEAQTLNPANLSQRLQRSSMPPELSRFISSFNDALERLESAYRQLEAFNVDVAHELRTPLTNLIGQAQVALTRERTATDLKEVLHSNLEELDRLRGIVNDMLFLARADRGEKAVEREEVSLAQEIGRTVDFLDVVMEEAGVRVQVQGDARVRIQSTLFQRAVVNLLQNAIEHVQRGSEILVSIAQESAGARVSVENRGVEIPPAHLPRIFDRFYRVDAARVGNGANHGLGLAIVKAIALMHGGTVFATSEGGVTAIGFTLGDTKKAEKPTSKEETKLLHPLHD